MRAVIDLCMKKSGINTGALQTFITTTSGTGASLLDGVCVSEDNFFDEDGEPMTLREVLEGVLRPFGLQMIQKDGCINLYDLHALWGHPAAPRTLVPRPKKVCNHCTLLCNHCTLLCNRCTLFWPADGGTHIFAHESEINC